MPRSRISFILLGALLLSLAAAAAGLLLTPKHPGSVEAARCAPVGIVHDCRRDRTTPTPTGTPTATATPSVTSTPTAVFTATPTNTPCSGSCPPTNTPTITPSPTTTCPAVPSCVAQQTCEAAPGGCTPTNTPTPSDTPTIAPTPCGGACPPTITPTMTPTPCSGGCAATATPTPLFQLGVDANETSPGVVRVEFFIRDTGGGPYEAAQWDLDYPEGLVHLATFLPAPGAPADCNGTDDNGSRLLATCDFPGDTNGISQYGTMFIATFVCLQSGYEQIEPSASSFVRSSGAPVNIVTLPLTIICSQPVTPVAG